MKKRRFRKISAYVLTLALILTSIAWPEVAKKASAAATLTPEQKAEWEQVAIPNNGGSLGDGNDLLDQVTAKDLNTYFEWKEADMYTSTKKNATVYIHITKASRYSGLRIRGGNVVSGYSSNRGLIGTLNQNVSDTSNTIHAGYGTGSVGTGIGAAGSGNYVFPAVSMERGGKAKDENDKEYAVDFIENAGIRLTRRTTDVEAYIIGIVFDTGKSVTVNHGKEGAERYTEGFDPKSITLESQTADDTDISPEEKEAAEKAEQEKIAAEKKSARDGLKHAIDAANAFSEDDYEAESLAALKAAIPAAEAVYNNDNATKEEYGKANDDLEIVRAKLVPKMTTEAGNPKEFRLLTKSQVINEMGAGINLGNTMDGGYPDPSETSWQAYKTTKAYIKALHDAGYNTVRVPVTWGNNINADYSIKEAWINRVQEIVDYCVDQDMYCIINIHHDGMANHDERGDNPGAWLNTAADDMESVYQKFAGTWKTIANRFKDYDEHLIFEGMNEVTDAHYTGSGHKAASNEDTDELNNLNQIFINTVRATGSNNTKRWLAITGRFNAFSTGTTMPEDKLKSSEAETTRLMFSVHIYKSMHVAQRSYSDLEAYENSLGPSVNNVKALDPNMPVYIGEYGQDFCGLSKAETGYNNVERALDGEFVNAICKSRGVCPIVWDQGCGNYLVKETGIFYYWNRPALEPLYQDTIDGMMRGTYLSRGSLTLRQIMDTVYMSYGHSDTKDSGLSTNPTIKEITEINLDQDTVNLKAGGRKNLTATVAPEDTNDVLLWSTDDDAIVTVSQGRLHAKGVGITYVHAYSQSGSVTKDIKVVVSPSGNETAEAITTDKAYYQVELGEQVAIHAALTPADSQDAITYTSSNTEVVTVNNSGVVTAENVGSAYITISAASGVSTIVNICVIGKGNYIDVALHVMIGSVTEKGESVKLDGDGQYTVSYDMEKQLSAAGQEAGLTALKDMTSIFIRDLNTLKPLVKDAKIRYDRITVNDQELTITKTDFKNAIKDNGQFDTNDPINGWDGNAVQEATQDTSKHVSNFVGIDNPTRISVTFTIEGMTFLPTSEKTNEAKTMTNLGDEKVRIPAVGEEKEIGVSLTPTDTDSFVTFYSTNSAVVAVDNTAKAVDEDGNVKVTLIGLSEGTATITAITENGLKVFWSVGVGEDTEIPDPTDPTPPNLDGSQEDPEPGTPGDATPTPGPGGSTSGPGDSTPTPGPGGAGDTSPGPDGSGDQTPGAGDPTQAPDGSGDQTPDGDDDDDDDTSNKVTVKIVTLQKVTSAKKKTLQVQWKKLSGVTGYHVQVTTDKKFKKGVKTYTVKKAATTKTTIKKLKSKKTYYVRVRAYKTVSGKNYVGSWSKTKKKKVK